MFKSQYIEKTRLSLAISSEDILLPQPLFKLHLSIIDLALVLKPLLMQLKLQGLAYLNNGIMYLRLRKIKSIRNKDRPSISIF